MAVTLVYPLPLKRFVRNYITGFVGSADVSHLVISGGFLRFDYLYPLYHVDLKINPVFLPPSSNTYTLDYVFDGAASQTYLLGTPIASTQGVEFYVMRTAAAYRIRILSTLSPLETQSVDLTPPTNYWRLPV